MHSKGKIVFYKNRSWRVTEVDGVLRKLEALVSSRINKTWVHFQKLSRATPIIGA
jgi:hypothetical protein